MSLIRPSRCLPAVSILIEIGLARVVAAILRVLAQDFAVADDGVERRAQFVAHIGEEGRLGAGGGFGLMARFLGFLARLADFARIVAEHGERAAHVAEFVVTGRRQRRIELSARYRQHRIA